MATARLLLWRTSRAPPGRVLRPRPPSHAALGPGSPRRPRPGGPPWPCRGAGAAAATSLQPGTLLPSPRTTGGPCTRTAFVIITHANHAGCGGGPDAPGAAEPPKEGLDAIVGGGRDEARCWPLDDREAHTLVQPGYTPLLVQRCHGLAHRDTVPVLPAQTQPRLSPISHTENLPQIQILTPTVPDNSRQSSATLVPRLGWHQPPLLGYLQPPPCGGNGTSTMTVPLCNYFSPPHAGLLCTDSLWTTREAKRSDPTLYVLMANATHGDRFTYLPHAWLNTSLVLRSLLWPINGTPGLNKAGSRECAGSDTSSSGRASCPAFRSTP
jgi:hypothetical protein